MDKYLQPEKAALQSFADWIYVRNAITILRQSMQTEIAFATIMETTQFTKSQRRMTLALRRIYCAGKHQIYSVFAEEDKAVQLFHLNVKHAI